MEIRVASIEEMTFVMELAAKKGWNPGQYDAHNFHIADPAGFFVAILEDELVGAIAAVKYSNQYAFLGLYIVERGYRGRGIGQALFAKGMQYLDGYRIGLDSVLAQMSLYESHGFRAEHRNRRYAGLAPKGSMVEGVVSAHAIAFDELMQFDQLHYGAERGPFLSNWIQQPDSQSLIALEGDKLVGYGVRRACLQGHKIGPLFAHDEQIAERLWLGLCMGIEGERVMVDPPETNEAFFTQYDLEVVFETYRMYRGEPLSLPLDQIYGITSFELG